MYKVDVYLRVRRAVMVDGMSIREASRVFGLHRDTVRKMLVFSVPPGYLRQSPPKRPKLEPFTGVIDRILEDDLGRPRKQRHTAKRIFERLREEYRFDGQYTIVKDYVREHRRQSREMFVPLSHAPGHAQCDFGEALVVIGGVEQKAHCFVIDLPHSDGCFVKAYPAETTEAFLDGHVSAFAFLGGVPQSILYDNTKLAVARILGDGRRKRTRAFTELQSHYLFDDRFGRPGKGNDKGKVEGLVGYVRRNFLVPIPSFANFEALNTYLEQRCLERMDAKLRGHSETIGQRMERDLEVLLPLPPVAYGHRDVLVRGYVDQVVISCGSEVIAKHHRSYERDDFVYDPIPPTGPFPTPRRGRATSASTRPWMFSIRPTSRDVGLRLTTLPGRAERWRLFRRFQRCRMDTSGTIPAPRSRSRRRGSSSTRPTGGTTASPVSPWMPRMGA